MALARAELYFPVTYNVLDDWRPKLGFVTLGAWETLHTWVDRRNPHRKYDLVPYSLNEVQNKLGMTRGYFYKHVIRPLWSYGLIDLVEYEHYPSQYGNKPLNIIVHKYPYGNPDNATRPLEALRDYDTDYKSAAREHGKLGGRPTHRKYAQKNNPRSLPNICLDGSEGDLIIGNEESHPTVEEIQTGLNNLFDLPNNEKTNNTSEDKIPALLKQQHNPRTNVQKTIAVDLETHKLVKKCHTTITVRFGDRPEVDTNQISLAYCSKFVKEALQRGQDPINIINRVDTDYRDKNIGTIQGILMSAISWEAPVSAGPSSDKEEEIQHALHALEGAKQWAQDEKEEYGRVKESTLNRIFSLQMKLYDLGVPLA